jgi:hypothetical protein
VVGGGILFDRGGGRIRLVVFAPVVLVDGKLTSRGSTPRSAASAGGSSLSAGEVESLGENNHARGRVTQVRDQLGCGAGVDRGGRATTSDALGETLCGAGDTDGSGSHSECCKDSCDLHVGSW